MNDLKTRIARGEYEVDSRAVAEAMIAKLRTVSRVRTQIDNERQPRPSSSFGPSAHQRRLAH